MAYTFRLCHRIADSALAQASDGSAGKIVGNGIETAMEVQFTPKFISNFRHPDGRRGPGFPRLCWLQVWVPAFAGMTEGRVKVEERKIT
jgi:hypothetical protein